jgi:hypothetical protein
LLVLWCVGGRCGMADNDKDRGKSRRPVAEDWGWSSVGRIHGGRMIGMSGDIVCSLHCTYGDEEHMFLS